MTWMMRGARELAKNTLALTFHRVGALPLIANWRRQLGGARVYVLAFHRIVDDIEALAESVSPSLCIETRTFERLCSVAREHFDVVTLEEAADIVNGRRTPTRDALALTFDDGYRDVYLRARPVLARLGLPATVFVPTGYIGAARPLEHDRVYALLVAARRRWRRLSRAPVPPSLRAQLERAEAALDGSTGAMVDAVEALIAGLPAAAITRLGDALEDRLGETARLDDGGLVMNEDELAALVRSGFALGAHTDGHVVLTHEAPPRVERELAEPRRRLGEIAGTPCRAFAYCNGLWNRALHEAVRRAGYDVAVTTYDMPNRVGQDPLLLGRKAIWEGHARGLGGAYSEALVLAHLHHLFGDLALSHPVDGRTDA